MLIENLRKNSYRIFNLFNLFTKYLGTNYKVRSYLALWFLFRFMKYIECKLVKKLVLYIHV